MLKHDLLNFVFPMTVILSSIGVVAGEGIGKKYAREQIAQHRGLSEGRSAPEIVLGINDPLGFATLNSEESIIYRKGCRDGIILGSLAGGGLVGLIYGRMLWGRHKKRRKKWENFPAAYIHNPNEYHTKRKDEEIVATLPRMYVSNVQSYMKAIK